MGDRLLVLRFKVYRLQHEKRARYRKVHGRRKKFYIRRLVLRDKLGWIHKEAKGKLEEYELRQWYVRYNRKKALEQLLAVRKLKEHIRRIKADVRRRGFVKQLSIYGITRNSKTKKRVYRRYEIFKAYPWTRTEVAAIHDFFKKSPPTSHAGVFIYHNDKLLIVGSDKVTVKGTGSVGYTGERRDGQLA